MELPVVLFFGLSVGIKVYSYVYRKTTRSKVASKCAEISELVIFPVKSMRGVKVNQATCTQRGLSHSKIFDRLRMI